jgi:23S rRNA pseudouridine1911/1915/1917 synthase
MVRKIQVNDPADIRLDAYLKEVIPEISRSQIQRLIKEKKVSVDSRPAKKNHIVKVGNIITINDFEVRDNFSDIKAQDIDIKILFEDINVIVISKKAGMISHPTGSIKEGTVVNALLYHFKDLSDTYGKSRAGIIHRLDKETSGIMIIAKNNHSHAFISKQFSDRKIKKSYMALVYGLFKEATGEIDLPIGRKKDEMTISVDKGKDSLTRFRVLEAFDGCSYIKALPKTGRTHQIRVHFSYIGHPLLGDKKYGNKESGLLSKELGLKRHFLHADSIEFINPTDNKILKIKDDIAKDLHVVLNRLRCT